jgi:ribosomal protein L29
MATKKAAKEAPVVKTIEELKAELATKQQDLVEATRGNKLGELVNPRVLGQTRKEIARLHTAIRAIELAEVKEKK